MLVAHGAARMLDCMSEQTIALVTGANKGIGYAIAAGLGALGWSVGVGARDDQRREEAVAKLIAAGVAAFGVALDVTDDRDAAGRRPDRRIVRRHWDRPLVRVSLLLRRSVSPLVPVETIRRLRRGGLSP